MATTNDGGTGTPTGSPTLIGSARRAVARLAPVTATAAALPVPMSAYPPLRQKERLPPAIEPFRFRSRAGGAPGVLDISISS
ncbi:hypothetical protein AB0G74_02780 [Streptomyces sp. NPDC020875]|uniref:hypothetical protein n=1 Tax=Streptomyces sp. NPDC020875 TaxID=3154898 RepID=UPI0033FD0513